MSKSTFVHNVETDSIAGNDYGRPGVARSPVSLDELRQLEATVGWSAEDAKVLQRHGDLFTENSERMVDSWRAVIGAQPHLAKWFFGPDEKPDDEYKAKVKKRFVRGSWTRASGRTIKHGSIIKKRSGCATHPKRRIKRTALKHRRLCRSVI